MPEVKRLSQKDMLNKFYSDYNLSVESDVHEQKTKQGKLMFRIITRTGIEKIQAALNINVTHELVNPQMYHPINEEILVSYNSVKEYGTNDQGETILKSSTDSKTKKIVPIPQVTVLTTGTILNKDGVVIRQVESFGEANTKNCRNDDYLFAMAEKRGLSRVVLKLAGMYAFGFYGEDEADDFQDAIKAKRAGVKTEG